MITLKELREKSVPELEKLLQEQQEALRTLRFKVSAEEVKNVREIRVVRTTIARIHTIVHEKNNHHSHGKPAA